MKRKLRGCYVVYVKGIVWSEYESDSHERLSKESLERDLGEVTMSKVWSAIQEHGILDNVLDVNAYLNGLGTFSVEIIREEE